MLKSDWFVFFVGKNIEEMFEVFANGELFLYSFNNSMHSLTKCHWMKPHLIILNPS